MRQGRDRPKVAKIGPPQRLHRRVGRAVAYRGKGLGVMAISDFCNWHKADMLNALTNVRFWGQSGHYGLLAPREGSDAARAGRVWQTSLLS
jgi:hypothetical protein